MSLVPLSEFNTWFSLGHVVDIIGDSKDMRRDVCDVEILKNYSLPFIQTILMILCYLTSKLK